MSRSLIISVIAAMSVVCACQAMQHGARPFVTEAEIDHIEMATKYITDKYITASGEIYYRERTQESYCAQLINGGNLSTTRTNMGQQDSFRSIRFGLRGESLVDLSENPFRIVQNVVLARMGARLALQQAAA